MTRTWPVLSSVKKMRPSLASANLLGRARPDATASTAKPGARKATSGGSAGPTSTLRTVCASPAALAAVIVVVGRRSLGGGRARDGARHGVEQQAVGQRRARRSRTWRVPVTMAAFAGMASPTRYSAGLTA